MKTTILTLLLLATLITARGQEVNIFIASDGEELYYTKYGDGPIVVLLYGGRNGNPHQWGKGNLVIYCEFEQKWHR